VTVRVKVDTTNAAEAQAIKAFLFETMTTSSVYDDVVPTALMTFFFATLFSHGSILHSKSPIALPINALGAQQGVHNLVKHALNDRRQAVVRPVKMSTEKPVTEHDGGGLQS